MTAHATRNQSLFVRQWGSLKKENGPARWNVTAQTKGFRKNGIERVLTPRRWKTNMCNQGVELRSILKKKKASLISEEKMIDKLSYRYDCDLQSSLDWCFQDNLVQYLSRPFTSRHKACRRRRRSMGGGGDVSKWNGRSDDRFSGGHLSILAPSPGIARVRRLD